MSACLCALTGMLALACGTAQATVTHEYLSQITAVPSEGPHKEAVPVPGKLSGVNSITADSGKLYLAEQIEGPSGERRVDEFDAASGAFDLQFAQVPALETFKEGVAVGHAGGEQVYVGTRNLATGEGAVAVFGPTGGLLSTWEGAKTPSGSFGNKGVNGEAVDNSASGSWANGDVYVADIPEHAIYVFNPAAAKAPGEETAPVTELTESEAGVPLDLEESDHAVAMVVDQFNGDLLVAESDGPVDVFQPTGLGEFTLLRRLTGTSSASPFAAQSSIIGLSADAQNGDIYVAENATGAVDQFSATGEYLGQLAGTPSGAFNSVRAVTVDPASGHVYVDDGRPRGGVVDAFSQSLIVPNVTIGQASEVRPRSATLNGTVNLAKAGNATCEFVWGTTTKFGHIVACSSEVSAEEAAVSAKLEGLLPDTTYYYLLQASNANGTNKGAAAEAECEGKPAQYACFTTPGPGVEPEWTTDVASTSATLNATIRPHGVETSYYFQYGREDCATAVDACESVPAPPGKAVGSTGGVLATQHVQELAPGTLYHYRVVAVSEEKAGEPETTFGFDQTFTTQSTAGASGLVLPDSRMWELVSPPNKHGANPEEVGLGVLIQAAASGDAFTYGTNGVTEAQPPSNANITQSYAVRGPAGGWVSRNISVPRETPATVNIGGQTEYTFFSEDLSLGVVEPFGAYDPLLSAEGSESTPYIASEYQGGNTEQLCSSTCYRPLVTGAPGKSNVPAGTTFGKQGCIIYGESAAFCGPSMVDATPDLKHVVLQSLVALTIKGGTAGFGGLYEWSDGKLAPVSVLPESEEGVAGFIGDTVNEAGNARHAISADGSRVFWEGQDEHLYMRDTVKGETVRLDVPDTGAPAEAESKSKAVFQDASSDGSRVFFTDTTPLTENAGAEEKKSDLYECEMVEGASDPHCVLSDLTPLGAGESAADVRGMVLGTSEDGSYIYFAAGGVLAAGAVPGTCDDSNDVAPTCNLYVIHNGTTKLVAVLSAGYQAGDSSDWAGGGSAIDGLTARVSSDGAWVAFASNRSLTGYDNLDANSGQPDEEVYLYDAQANGGAGKLVCASCMPSAERPVGVEFGDGFDTMPVAGAGSNWPSTDWLAADIPGWTNYLGGQALYQSRYLSDSGRLFFNSDDALVPQDVNATWDVYEYEPPGVGSCTTSQSTFRAGEEGCVGLISSGASAEESAFLDASATGGSNAEGAQGGGDVFFLTAAKLALQDDDTSLDVYDAHECTSASPCTPTPPPSPPACVTADSCRAASTPQPAIFGSPASATFTGEGNMSPTPASKVGQKIKPLTRAQKLATALKACKRKRGRAKRTTCQKQAHKRYGPANAKKSSNATRRMG